MVESIGVVPAGPPAISPRDGAPCTWTVRHDDEVTVWDQTGPPPGWHDLQPVRRPRSVATSRHIPVEAHSATVGGALRLESGLEHDLVRYLDRSPQVTWLLPQPARLAFRLVGRSRPLVHVPDLLSLGHDGAVTVWDARRTDAQDGDFDLVARLTRDACHAHGWGYRVFSGLSPAVRHNLLWLQGFRRPQPWYAPAWPALADLARDGCRIEAILSADDQVGSLRSAMWHHLWRGDLETDLDHPLTAASILTVAAQPAL